MDKHWRGCWTVHLACAVRRVRAFERQIQEMDNSVDAWLDVLRRLNIAREAQLAECRKDLAALKKLEAVHRREEQRKLSAVRAELAECRDKCAALDETADALVEERDQYDADLERCRESLKETAKEMRHAQIFAAACARERGELEASLAASEARELGHELREALAELEHRQWLRWAGAVASEVSGERQARWQEYMVPYGELAEEVKEYDRAWADKVLVILAPVLEQARSEVLTEYKASLEHVERVRRAYRLGKADGYKEGKCAGAIEKREQEASQAAIRCGESSDG